MLQIKQSWLVLNSKCNNRCDWCYGKKYYKQGSIIELEALRKTITFLFRIGCNKIVFLGGEPTLYLRCSPILRQAFKVEIL